MLQVLTLPSLDKEANNDEFWALLHPLHPKFKILPPITVNSTSCHLLRRAHRGTQQLGAALGGRSSMPNAPGDRSKELLRPTDAAGRKVMRGGATAGGRHASVGRALPRALAARQTPLAACSASWQARCPLCSDKMSPTPLLSPVRDYFRVEVGRRESERKKREKRTREQLKFTQLRKLCIIL